jgi:hypothetical protein
MERCGYSKRCAWCGRVKLGDGWIQERRVGIEQYSHGICGECLAKLYLTELEVKPGGPSVRG